MLGLSYSYRTGLQSVGAKHEFSVEKSYNEEHGTSSTVETTTKLEWKISLEAAAKMKTVLQLVVKKASNVTIPSTAKVKRTKADGSVSITEEEGTWHGVASSPGPSH